MGLPTVHPGGFPLAAVALGTWLGYGIWVMLFAKLLGGRSTLAGFFSTTALYAVPHLLSFFAFIPVSRRGAGLHRVLLGPGDLRQGHVHQSSVEPWSVRYWRPFCRCSSCSCWRSLARPAWQR